MVRYFEPIPAAAVRREIDGHLYAYVQHTVTPQGVRQCPARMVRADDARIRDGVALVYLGSMGDAIAQRVNVPFPVVFEPQA